MVITKLNNKRHKKINEIYLVLIVLLEVKVDIFLFVMFFYKNKVPTAVEAPTLHQTY